MTSFTQYYARFFFSPRQTAAALIGDPARLRLGTQAVAITAFLYTLVYVFLWIGDGRPFAPWLTIPPDQYYRWNRWFLAPTMFASWILAAGIAQMLGRASGGNGSFEEIASLFGFGVAIASCWTLFHDLISSALGAAHVINQQAFEHALNTPTIWRTLLWTLMVGYLVWFVALFSMAVALVHRLRLLPAAAIGSFAFVAYQLLFFVFNR